MLRIRDMLVRILIRIRGSVPLTNGFGSGSGSGSFYFRQWSSRLLSRTYGVSIFIDYCTALRTQRKVEGEERDNIFVFNLRFKIDVVVMIIRSIVIIINSVLTLQVSTASLPHDCEPCEIKVVSNHTCSFHTCVCAGSRRVRVRLSGFRWRGISSTPGGFLKCSIPVRVFAEQLQLKINFF